MNIYVTLNGEFFDFNKLTEVEQELFSRMIQDFEQNLEWAEFKNLWMKEIKKAFLKEEITNIVEMPIYKIYQDLGSKLGIKQGYTRDSDYRDLLKDLINLKYASRYQFCKQTGFDESYLSNILNKRRELSIQKLEQILKTMGYRIEFVEEPEEPNKLVAIATKESR